jgi:hypothetical protein
MSKPTLDLDSITFGKYTGCRLEHVLKDRSYSKWLLEQDWFQTNYEYLYNRVKSYDPKVYFFKKDIESMDFLEKYRYFNMVEVDNLKIKITEDETKCYKFYLDTIEDIKRKIVSRVENGEENIFDIKAPVKWLQKFEKDTGLSRDVFKEFLSSYELQNITYIIEDIKKEGGITYNGAQSFKIAKQRANLQEKWWESILKEKYGEDLGTQFKYENCIFDFINISTNTIFECKLGLKDFNEDQYKKYILALNKYRIIYIIGYDCVINIEKSIIYTTDVLKYILYQQGECKSKFDRIIKEYNVVKVEDLSTLFGKQ